MAAAARARHDNLTKPPGSLGRLEDLSVWVSSCQGVCPPRPFQRARVVVFAGDHGVTAAGVSAYPAEVTAQMVANFDAGGAAINVLAEVAGATVRVVDVAVDASEPLSPSIGAHKVRRGSGNIAVEDALTDDEVAAALDAGRRIADEEVDSGADILIAGDMGIGNTTPATTLIAALTDSEPVAVIGRGTGVDDAGWARKTAAIRDALFRSREAAGDPVALLRVCGGADLAAMAGFCAQAAVRRTPLLLDGVVVTAAALVAEELAPGARQWWQAGHRSTEPAHAVALRRLDLEPIVDMRMRLGEGTGAAVALPIVRAAVAALASMATFDEAGITCVIRSVAGGACVRHRAAGAHVRAFRPWCADGVAAHRRGAGSPGGRDAVGGGVGVRPVGAPGRRACGGRAAARHPWPACRRAVRHRRRPRLLRPAAARAGGDARRVGRARSVWRRWWS